MHSRQAIVLAARKWLGVRWRHQGRSASGVDCAGLIALVAKELCISNFDMTNYQRRTHGQLFVNIFRDQLVLRTANELFPGNVALFTDPMYPCHCAIVSHKYGEPHIIHAHAQKRCVVEEYVTQEWHDKLTHVFEFPEVEPWRP